MKTFILIAGIALLIAIFIRRYVMVMKGSTAGTSFLKHRDILHFFHDSRDFEVTADEILPSAENVSPKSVAKATLLFKKAEMHMERGELQQAEKTLIQALSLNPAFSDAYNKLGLIYLSQQQFGKAENIYRKLILSESNEPIFFSNLGMALYGQKKLDEAKNFYKKALELDSSRSGRFFSLGQICNELNHLEEAVEHLRKAVEMEPRNMNYLLALAQLYIDGKKLAEAKKLLGEILLVSPRNEDALKMMEVVQKI